MVANGWSANRWWFIRSKWLATTGPDNPFGRDCHVFYWTFSRFPAFCSLDASNSSPLTSAAGQQNGLKALPSVPWRAKSPLLRITQWPGIYRLFKYKNLGIFQDFMGNLWFESPSQISYLGLKPSQLVNPELLKLKGDI